MRFRRSGMCCLSGALLSSWVQSDRLVSGDNQESAGLKSGIISFLKHYCRAGSDHSSRRVVFCCVLLAQAKAKQIESTKCTGALYLTALAHLCIWSAVV